jgi:N-dimethylarginine dimethylaminohydrolase
MWTVNSESGRLNAVLIQDSVESFWEKRLPFEGVESSLQYLPRCVHPQMEGGHEQWLQLPRMLGEEGVRVFEVTGIIGKALEEATLKEKKVIIKEIWAGFAKAPKPEELRLEHLIYGYPDAPYYDTEQDRVVLPDFRRVAWPYSRDTSFTTQVGTVICNMRRYSRRHEVRVVKLAYELDPTLAKHVEIVWDANEAGGVTSEPPNVEGGDTQIIDTETVAIGMGQRSTLTGIRRCAEELFRHDREGRIRYVCAVQLPDYPALDYMHLDVTINYPDAGRALVMPYVWDTEVVKGMPPKKLLLKTLEALRQQSDADYRPMGPMIHPDGFRHSGRTTIYVNKGGKPEPLRTEVSLIDFLVKEGKLDADGLMYVGGLPEKENDVDHIYAAFLEQARGAGNIVATRPKTVIAYQRNRKTIGVLRENGIRVREWEDSWLDLLGGPHCSTSPLSRD